MLYVFIDYSSNNNININDPAMLYTCLLQLEDHLKVLYRVYVIVHSELSSVHKTLQTLTNCKYIQYNELQEIVNIIDSHDNYKLFINYCTMLTKDITILYPCYVYTNKLDYICRKDEQPCGYLYDEVNTQSYREFIRSPKDGHDKYTNYTNHN